MAQGIVKSGSFEAGSERRVLSSELQNSYTYFWRDAQRTLFILSPKLTKPEENPLRTGFPTQLQTRLQTIITPITAC